jgi:hypothetical protein
VGYRGLTVSREFGSGGGRIAKIVAQRLHWKLQDRELIEAIALSAHVDSRVVTHLDERAESWLGRINRRAMRGAALAADWSNPHLCDLMISSHENEEETADVILTAMLPANVAESSRVDAARARTSLLSAQVVPHD